MKYIQLNCAHCQKIFNRLEKEHQNNIKRGRKNSFCSHKCNNEYNKERIVMNCKWCKKEIFRTPAAINPNNFCSHSCSMTYHNHIKRLAKPPIVKLPKPPRPTKKKYVTCLLCGKESLRIPSKTHGKRFCNRSCAMTYQNRNTKVGSNVSKLERWLQGELPILYPDLDFHFNRRDTIRGELDIYIPALQLAFELNGVFHYKPIFSIKQFVRTQSNDQRKMQACIDKGIILHPIDVSWITSFRSESSNKILTIIQNIINQRLRADGFAPPIFRL